MTTDLFAVTAGIEPTVVQSAIPPPCRREIARIDLVQIDDDEALLETPAWEPRGPARHFIPALSVLADVSVSFRFELSIDVAGLWSPWVASVPIGSASFPAVAAGVTGLRCDVDLFTTSAPARAVRVRVRLRADRIARLLSRPWLFTLSACDLEPGPSGSTPAGRVDLHGSGNVPVPALSQMDANDALARRICAPTCVAMVLRHWGHPVNVETLAAEVFQPAVDLYGVWPAAVAAAARRGIAGYLLRFPDWGAVRWCLDAGLPIVASVRYTKDELTGAAIAETGGHLIVVTGYDGEDVLVNDPAAPTRSNVARRYRRVELERVWLERTGVGQVFFDPAPSTQR
jgi:hypothetical protein